MLKRHLEELSTKPVEIVLAYMECYDEFASALFDEGDWKSICDFGHFYDNCQENWQDSYPTYTEGQFLNDLLDQYGCPPRF